MKTKRYHWAARWDIERRPSVHLWRWLTPPRMFGASFILLILAGTAGLVYLPGMYTGEPLDWIDALFTITSAVCVTGLTVVDTGTYFTLRGQAWVLLFIQLGGLGIIAFSSLIIVALGRRLSLRQQALSTDIAGAAPHLDTRRLTFDVVRFTFIFEGVGALILYMFWAPRLGWREAMWPAAFHSVSAFCNAGFSTFSDNVMSFYDAPLTLTVLMTLIIFGGLGFLTLEELWLRYQAGRKKQIFRLSLHSRLVLATTAVLLVVGCVMFALFEWNRTLGGMRTIDKLANAMFMSVTCRTAGYNSIDYAKASDGANFLTIILMSIGGSPGSTAGGIKTTTFAMICLLAWARLRGLETTSFRGRSIRKEATERAFGLVVIAFGLLTAGIFALIATEQHAGREPNFLARMFEVFSAFNTVGLTMGETPSLSKAGRLVISLLMYVGRVGPLTVGAAIALRQSRSSGFRYAYEDVVVG